MANTPYFRVQIKFRQFDRTWEEVYGNNAGTIAQAFTNTQNCLTAALAFRAPSVYVQWVRISNPYVPRQAQIFHVTIPDFVFGSVQPEVTSTAAIYEFNSTVVGVKRRIWVRGLKNNQVTRRPATGQDIPAGDLESGVQSYFAQLLANNFGVPALVSVDTGDNKRHPISSIEVQALQQVKVNTPDTYATEATNRVILYRIPQKLFPGLRGHVTITPATGSFVVQGYLCPLPVMTYPMTGAAFRQESWRFAPFASGAARFLAFDRRDTRGGPLDTRGRGRPIVRRAASTQGV